MSDVELAKNNAQLFSQTLSFTDPTQEDITKNELIQVSRHGRVCWTGTGADGLSIICVCATGYRNSTASARCSNVLSQNIYKPATTLNSYVSDGWDNDNRANESMYVFIAALILANGELVNTFKAYDDMLERSAVDTATNNSRAVNHRGTLQVNGYTP